MRSGKNRFTGRFREADQHVANQRSDYRDRRCKTAVTWQRGCKVLSTILGIWSFFYLANQEHDRVLNKKLLTRLLWRCSLGNQLRDAGMQIAANGHEYGVLLSSTLATDESSLMEPQMGGASTRPASGLRYVLLCAVHVRHDHIASKDLP